MDKVLRLLKTTMNTPQPFGVFHLVCLFAVAAVSFFLCFFFRKAKEKTFRVVLVVIWSVLLLLEAVRQMMCSGSVNADGSVTWAYDWGAFPLQLCDFPFYGLPLLAFLKEGKVRDALACFMSTYVLLGGVAAYMAAETIFSASIFLNVDTVIHHGLQIASCVLIAMRFRDKLTLQNFALGFLVFLVTVGVATGFNVGMHALHPGAYINMFFISPYFKREMPLFNAAWQMMNFAEMLLIYVVGVTLFALALYLILALFFARSDPRRGALCGAAKGREKRGKPN